MYRRLYPAFPTAIQVRRAVADLKAAGIPTDHVHAAAKEGTDLVDLPGAAEGQKHDEVSRLKHPFWNSNLGVFALAAQGFAASLLASSSAGVAVSLGVMLATFIVGKRFPVTLPHAHLTDPRVRLEHGEVVLLVPRPLAGPRDLAPDRRAPPGNWHWRGRLDHRGIRRLRGTRPQGSPPPDMAVAWTL